MPSEARRKKGKGLFVSTEIIIFSLKNIPEFQMVTPKIILIWKE